MGINNVREIDFKHMPWYFFYNNNIRAVFRFCFVTRDLYFVYFVIDGRFKEYFDMSFL